jgi:hypothetical protein
MFKTVEEAERKGADGTEAQKEPQASEDKKNAEEVKATAEDAKAAGEPSAPETAPQAPDDAATNDKRDQELDVEMKVEANQGVAKEDELSRAKADAASPDAAGASVDP